MLRASVVFWFVVFFPDTLLFVYAFIMILIPCVFIPWLPDDGVMFDVTRDDGMSFHGKTVNLKPRYEENPARYRRKQ